MPQTVVAARHTPQILAVIDAYHGVNDWNGIPDTSCRNISFGCSTSRRKIRKSILASCKNTSRSAMRSKKSACWHRLAAQIDSVGHAVSVAGAVKTMRSEKLEKIHTAIAIQLEEE